MRSMSGIRQPLDDSYNQNFEAQQRALKCPHLETLPVRCVRENTDPLLCVAGLDGQCITIVGGDDEAWKGKGGSNGAHISVDDRHRQTALEAGLFP